MTTLCKVKAKLGHQKPHASHGNGFFVHTGYRANDRVGEVDVHLGYMDIKVDRPKLKQPVAGKEGNKKRLAGWSRSSRNYLNRCLRSIVRGDTHPYMLTLTSQGYSEDTQVYHDQVDHFMISFERRFPDCSIVWRLEFQQRGAPHWHLLIYLSEGEPPILHEDKHWIAGTWYGIVGGDVSVMKYGTKLTDATDGEYAAKLKNYLLAFHHLKDNQVRDDIYTGRYWGIRNKKGLNMGPIAQGTLVYKAFVKLRRIARKLMRQKNKALGRSKPAQCFNRYLKRTKPSSFRLYLDFWQIDRIFEFCGIKEFERPWDHGGV